MADFVKNDDPFQLLSFDPAAVAIRAARNGDILEKMADFVKELDHYVRLNRQNLEQRTDLGRHKVDPGGKYKEITVGHEDSFKEHKEEETPSKNSSANPNLMYQQQQQQLGYGYGGFGGYPVMGMGIQPMFMPSANGSPPDVCFACGSQLRRGNVDPEEGSVVLSMPPLTGFRQQQRHPQQHPRKRPLETGSGEDHQNSLQKLLPLSNQKAYVSSDNEPKSTSLIRKGHWTKEEDDIVIEIVNRSPEQPFTAWSDLAQCLPGRTGKSIRDRWVNHLNPALSHVPFSEEDDVLLWKGYKQFGKRWVEISTKIFNSSRSENHVKNRFYSATFKKFVAKEYGPEEYNKAAKLGS